MRVHGAAAVVLQRQDNGVEDDHRQDEAVKPLPLREPHADVADGRRFIEDVQGYWRELRG